MIRRAIEIYMDDLNIDKAANIKEGPTYIVPQLNATPSVAGFNPAHWVLGFQPKCFLFVHAKPLLLKYFGTGVASGASGAMDSKVKIGEKLTANKNIFGRCDPIRYENTINIAGTNLKLKNTMKFQR